MLALLRHFLERMQENQQVRLHRECTPKSRKILMALDSLFYDGVASTIRHFLERMQEIEQVRLHRECTPKSRKILMALDLYIV